MNSFRRWLGASLAGLVSAIGCSNPVRSFPPRPSLLEAEQVAAAPLSPAEWRYHPRKAGKLAHAYALDERRVLWVASLGERWLVEAGADRAEPASSLAPEDLVAALRGGGASWVFVGSSGATYLADAPLGPLAMGSAPMERLAKVDAGNTGLVAVSRQGELWSSPDAGMTWQRSGPEGARFCDVLAADSHAIALQIPEQLWWSANHGRDWQRLDEPAFGAELLARDAEGPFVSATLGSRRIDLFAKPAPVLGQRERLVIGERADLGMPPREGPSARALEQGRAFLSHGEYFELELGVKASTLSGPFGERLRSHNQPDLSACHDALSAGFQRWVFVACSRERGSGSRRFDFFRSEDGGVQFTREPYWARGNFEELTLAVGDGGQLLVSGLCTPHENLSGCRPHGIQMRRERTLDAGTDVELEVVAAPALEGNAFALAFSDNGRVAYAIARRTKSDQLFSFVATGLEQGFRAHPIAELGPGGDNAPQHVFALTPARGGQLSLVVSQASGPSQLILLDSEGRPLSSNTGPTPAASIGAYGTRALAVSRDEAWESLDAGSSWESIGRLPSSPCAPSAPRCVLPVRCQDRGCVVGDTLSRLGWRGQVNPARMLGPRAITPRPSLQHAVSTAFSCELSNTEWKELPGVDRLPDAAQASLGKVAWFAMSSDDATAAAGLWIMDRASGARLRYHELLGSDQRAAEIAYQASLQVEGAAALRYKIPGSPGASPTHVAGIEVAWANLQDAQLGRGRISDAGPQLPGDYVKSDGVARRAQPDLLSISSGGIYVRVHRQPQHQQPAYFLDGDSVATLPPLVWPFSLPKGTTSEMVRVGTEHLALFFVNSGATVVRARQRNQKWHFDAMTLGFTDIASFALEQRRDIAYVGGHVGIHLTTVHADRSSHGEVFPLRAEDRVFGSGVRVPTQADLGSELVRCTAEQRAQTPRVVAPFHPGARHPVLIHDAVEPLRVLLSDSAILHGSADRACVEVFDAEPLDTAPAGQRERALLSVDALGPSWLFRAASDGVRRAPRIEYRSMTCRVDARADVPAEVFDAPGTLVDG